MGTFLRGLLRVLVFWAVTLGVTSAVILGLGEIWHEISLAQLSQSLRRAETVFDVFRDQGFALSLAGIIAALSVGLMFGFGSTVFQLRAQLRADRRRFEALTPSEYLERFRQIVKGLSQSPFGHALGEYAKTTFRSNDGVILQSTQRPHAFITVSVLRERSVALQFLGAAPGYFVGLGLLLTFVGLIAALSVAAPAVSAPNADEAKKALNDLLHAATFKFATSIAGLGGSLLLSFSGRFYTMLLETAVAKMAEAIERPLRFVSAQEMNREIGETLKLQLAALQNIDSDAFFSRLGNAVSPGLQHAMGQAVAPLTEKIATAVDDMRKQSVGGVQDMLEKFTQGLHGSAGTEMSALANTLGQLRESLANTRSGLEGSGSMFAKQLGEAVETMSARLLQVTEKMEAAAASNSAQLEQSMSRLADGFESAARKTTETLTDAATGAGGSLQNAVSAITDQMRPMFTSLTAQVVALGQTADAQREAGAASVQDMRRATQEATERVTADLERQVEALGAKTAAELERVLGIVGQRIDALSGALASAGAALERHANSTVRAADAASSTADAFATTADRVREASTPLTDVTKRFTRTAEEFTSAAANSLKAFEAGQNAAKLLAEELAYSTDSMKGFWEAHERRFSGVDQNLAAAVSTLGVEVGKQQARILEFTRAIDTEFSKSLVNLNGAISNFGEQAEAVKDAIEDFTKSVSQKS